MEKRKTGPTPIDSAIRSFLRESGLGLGPRQTKTFDAWTEALGPQLGRQAVPVRFQGGTLTVEVPSAAHLHELRNFTGEQYRARANAILGGETIRRIAYKVKG